MKLLVTGATGYIGTRLVALAAAGGHEVVAATRRRPAMAASWVHFDLADPQSLQVPDGIDAIVHLAANTTADDAVAEQAELAAARVLVDAARRAGARLVFVSSQTARADAPTAYGRIKWQIEQQVLAANGLVVRPGQVYGGPEEGLFGTLAKAARALPVLPAFIPAPRVQPIHVDDCAAGLLAFAARRDLPGGVHVLAAAESISFTDFLRSIARDRVHRYRLFVPVPVFLVRLAILALGLFSKTSFGLARLNSLLDLPRLDAAPALDLLALHLRPLHSGMHRSGSDTRRRLVVEATGLLTYVLRERPRYGLVSRYVRMVEKLRGGQPVALQAWVFRLPVVLAILDGRITGRAPVVDELRWRIGGAAVIAEASEQGFRRFLGGAQPAGFFAAFFFIAVAVMAEIAVRLAAIFSLPLLWLARRDGGA